MATRNFVYSMPDGSVRYFMISDPHVKNLIASGMTDQEALNSIRAEVVPEDATNIMQGDETDLPYRGSFRNAWKQDAAVAPVVDMAKARAIKTDQVRVQRAEKFTKLDTDYMRADEAGNAEGKSAVAAKKQSLRDMPETIQSDLAALDIEGLESFEPTWPE